MMTAACGSGAKRSPIASSDVPEPSAYRSARIASEGPALQWPYRDYRLRGSWRAMGRSGDTVLLVRNATDAASDRNEVHLLDLGSGRTAEILHRAVGAEQVVLGYAIGEGWVAWEETCENDLDRDPAGVVWRLYAAPFDARTLELGGVRRLDEGVLAARSRPRFGFDGTGLYVATTLRTSSDGSGTAGTSVIEAFDLPGTDRREVVRAQTPMSSFAVSQGRLVLTRRRSRGGDDDASRIEVFDTSGRRLLVFDPPRTGIVSHSPSLHDGSIIWAELMPGDGWATNIYLRSAEGSLTAVTFFGNDGCIAGDWAFAEASERTTESARTRSYAGGSQIYAVRLGTSTRHRLVEGLIDRGEWWQIAAPAVYATDRLVLYRDGSAFDGDGVSVIRVYRLPGVDAMSGAAGLR